MTTETLNSITDEIVDSLVEKAYAELEKRSYQLAAKPTAVRPLDEEAKPLTSPVRAWARDVYGYATADEKRLLDDLGWRGKNDITVPLNLNGGLFRAGESGDVIQTRIGQATVEMLSNYDAVRRVATVLTTDTMDKLTMPIVDDTSNTAALLSSSVDMTASVDPTISSVTLDCYTLQSKPIVIGTTLLRDSAVDLEQILADLIAQRIGRAANGYETTGTGSGQPTGLLASSGGVPTAKTAAKSNVLAWDELLDVIYAIDQAYRANAVWMMHPSILAAIQKIEDDYGRPLFYPDLTGQSPGRLLGYPVVENASMPSSLSASAKVAIFGDFKRYVIREVNQLRLLALQERFAEFDAVGFLAFYYFDAKLVAASTTRAIGCLTMGTST